MRSSIYSDFLSIGLVNCVCKLIASTCVRKLNYLREGRQFNGVSVQRHLSIDERLVHQVRHIGHPGWQFNRNIYGLSFGLKTTRVLARDYVH